MSLSTTDCEQRPVCLCHGEPQYRKKNGWFCAVAHRERQRRYYHENKETVFRRMRAARAFLDANKVKSGCSTCGYNEHPAALQFHHRDPGAKAFAVAGSGLSKSISTYKHEIAKCDVLCANCHAVLHANARDGNVLYKSVES